jgi:hypothetical protein
LGDAEPMRDVFATMVSPARAIAFDRLSRGEALKSHPELLPAYQRLDEFNRSVSNVHLEARAEAEAVARAALSRALHDGAIVGWRECMRSRDESRGVER